MEGLLLVLKLSLNLVLICASHLPNSQSQSQSAVPLTINPVQKYGKVILQSSNTPKEPEWESKGFIVRNVSVLLKEHYSITPPPSMSPDVNSSQVFCSNKSASLLVIIKDFKHPVMFLNFSYYIQGPVMKEPPGQSQSQVQGREVKDVEVTPGIIQNKSNLSQNLSTSSEIKLKIPENHDNKKVTPEPEPGPITHDLSRRRKRSASLTMNTTTSQQMPTMGNSSQSASTSLNSLTLVQAVEVIKNAAAVVAAAGIPSIPNPTGLKNENAVNGLITLTGHTVIPEMSKTNEFNVTSNNEHYPHSQSITEARNGDNDNDSHPHPQLEIESKINWPRNLRNKKVKVEIEAEKMTNEDEETEKLEESSSSSSSSEEDKTTLKRVQDNKKISYKTWRASLEKRNRPPGLYVTVNDDIVFDNWDGIWDKHHILGKWSGSKASPKTMDKEAWNQTYIFINWDEAAAHRHDVKIQFEWEPIDRYSHIILSDIVISTMVNSTICNSNHQSEGPVVNVDHEFPKSPHLLTSDTMVNDQPKSENSSNINAESVYVIKHNEKEDKSWQIIKMEKTSNSYKQLNLDDIQKKGSPNHEELDLFKVINSLEGNATNEVMTHNNDKQVSSSSSSSSSGALSKVNKSEVSLEAQQSENLSRTNNFQSDVPTSTEIPIAGSRNNISINNINSNLTNSSIISLSDPPTTLLPTSVAPTSPTTKSVQQSTSPAAKPASSNSSDNVTKIFPNNNNRNAPLEDHMNSNSTIKSRPGRKTDGQIALLMTFITGCLALAILVIIIKKKIDISTKGRNATR